MLPIQSPNIAHGQSSYFSLRYVVSDRAPTSFAGQQLALHGPAAVEAWERLLGIKSNFVPTLWGITHRDEDFNQHAELIRQARRNGAMSVGLELTPARYKAPNMQGHFESLAKIAEECGMTVFTLSTDDVEPMRDMLAKAYRCLGASGQLDDSTISSALDNIREIISYERTAEDGDEKRAVFFEKEADRWRLAREYLRSINYDVQKFSSDWYRVHIVRTNSDMMEAIERHQPDLVLIGNHHAQELSHLQHYDHMSGTSGSDISDEAINKFIPKTYGDLRLAFDKVVYDINREVAMEVIKGFKKLMMNAYGKPSRHEQALEVLNTAVSLRPDILKLFIRFFRTMPHFVGHLAPDRDMDVLVIPHDTAGRLLKQTIESAFYRNGLM